MANVLFAFALVDKLEKETKCMFQLLHGIYVSLCIKPTPDNLYQFRQFAKLQSLALHKYLVRLQLRHCQRKVGAEFEFSM